MTIQFRPTTKQFEAWSLLTDGATTEIGFGGGAGGGKSRLGCFWLLSNCLAYPGTRWLMGRKELSNLRKTTLMTFFEVCAAANLEKNSFNLNNQTNIITFSNGSQILLFDLAYQPSDPLYNRLGSLELTGAFIDESPEVHLQCISIVLTRLGRCKNAEYNLKPKLLETFNPDKGHVYSRFYKPWKRGELPEHRRFIRALPTDNPHLNPDYLRQLQNSDPITKERLLYGNFEYDDDPTALMDFDAIQDLFTNVGEDGQACIVVDVARFGNDRTVVSRWEGLRAVEWHVYKGLPTTETEIKILELAVKWSIPRSRIVVDSDGVGGGVADHIPGCKQFVANSTPVEQDTNVTNYANLKAQCAYLLADHVKARRIAVKCDAETRDGLIQELEQVKAHEPDKERKLRVMPKDMVKERIGRSPDLSDCMLMRMYLELMPHQRAGAVQTDQKPHFYKPRFSAYAGKIQG